RRLRASRAPACSQPRRGTPRTRTSSTSPLDQPQPLAEQERQVKPTVPPLLQLHLADPRPVRDVLLAKAEAAEYRLELDLLAERHAVRRDVHALEDRAAEHPHAGLA